MPVRMQHLHAGAFPFHHFAAEQSPVRADIGIHERPGDGGVTHGPASGESRPEGDRDAARRKRA